MRTPTSEKLEQIDSHIERNYIEPYKRAKHEELSEAMQAKIELAYSIKHILRSI